MALQRVNVAWQNWPGAPGLTTFFFDTISQTKIDALRTFFNALITYLPNNLTIQVPSTGDYIDEATGGIGGTWSVGTTPTVVTGSSASAYAGNAGMCIHWLTSGIIAGRRVRGRTFLVPFTSSAFEANGTPAAAAVTALTNAGNALLTTVGTSLQVWSRPVVAHTRYDPKTGAGTAVAGRAGSAAPVTGVRVPDLAISLRSRRV